MDHRHGVSQQAHNGKERMTGECECVMPNYRALLTGWCCSCLLCCPSLQLGQLLVASRFASSLRFNTHRQLRASLCRSALQCSPSLFLSCLVSLSPALRWRQGVRDGHRGRQAFTRILLVHQEYLRASWNHQATATEAVERDDSTSIAAAAEQFCAPLDGFEASARRLASLHLTWQLRISF